MLIILIIFIIILIILIILSIILILTSVTSYKLQHVFVSRDEWSSVGHADIRRFTFTAIIVVIIVVVVITVKLMKGRKKEKLTGSKSCGDCVASHPIKETTREIRDGTYCR